VLFLKSETFVLGIRLEPLYLVIDVLSSRLAWGRNPSVEIAARIIHPLHLALLLRLSRPPEQVQICLIPTPSGVAASPRGATNGPVSFHGCLPDWRIRGKGIRVWAALASGGHDA
jgi:hypothetical protein